MSAIFIFCRYACHVTTGVTQYFYLPNTNHFALKTILCLPFEISRSLKTFKTSTNQYLVSNEYFYMVNPCCDLTKTTVNEIKNLSKMADITLLQVKIFQELSKIWKSKYKVKVKEVNIYTFKSSFKCENKNLCCHFPSSFKLIKVYYCPKFVI